MYVQPYRTDELHFAWCYHVYFRWATHRRTPCEALAALTSDELSGIVKPYDLHVLEANTSDTDMLVLASLLPAESVSSAASKLKGQISKWLGHRLSPPGAAKHQLKRGYFACTSGHSTSKQVEEYLSRQGDHHGYTRRPVPPVYVRRYEPSHELLENLQTRHAVAVVKFHTVQATWRRLGLLGKDQAGAIDLCWQRMQRAERFVLLKVSFVPDHVHVAVRVHPSVSPAALTARLMNAAQEVMVESFSQTLIRVGAERLWQPSAYIGSFGDIASPMMQQYIRKWQAL